MFSNLLNPTVISNPDLSREELSEVLQDEELLQAIYGKNYYDIFSPDSTDLVLWHSNSDMCGSYAPHLLDQLRDRNIRACTATSYDSSSSYHVFVVLHSKNDLILLDPSIGQYLVGYKGIYIGTPSELHTLVRDPSTKLHPVIFTRDDFYSRTWGNSIGTAFGQRLRIV